MAQVTTQHTDQDLFDWDLSTTKGYWESLPEMATEWHEWDIDSRMDFLTDWPVTEERTARFWRNSKRAFMSNDAAIITGKPPILAAFFVAAVNPYDVPTTYRRSERIARCDWGWKCCSMIRRRSLAMRESG